MTKVPVNVPGFTPNMMYGSKKVQETDTKGDFGKIFENQKNANTEVKTQENVSKDEVEQPQDVEKVENKEPAGDEVVETKNPEGVKETTETQNSQQTDTEAEGEELSEEAMNMVMPVIQEAVMDVKAILAQELGISQEELDALMEEMGLTEMDLLQQGTLKDIVLQVKGVEDMTALLTDEELYSQMQSIEASFAEVMGNVQAQLTDEEMAALKEQLADLTKAEGSVITLETDAVTAVKTSDETSKDAPNQEGENAFLAQGQHQSVFTQQNTNAATQLSSAQAASFVDAQTESIMNQIMDYMKIQLDADTSSLEMQLQPESLGTLQIRISAKEGIMTAQFTTASETVKAALESQMVQLQQQLENQNIKVDAIEVTVQTHQFESALEQGEERQQAEDSKKNKSRRIDLTRMDEMEEIPEDDRIVAEMMAANGNTVDYLA